MQSMEPGQADQRTEIRQRTAIEYQLPQWGWSREHAEIRLIAKVEFRPLRWRP